MVLDVHGPGRGRGREHADGARADRIHERDLERDHEHGNDDDAPPETAQRAEEAGGDRDHEQDQQDDPQEHASGHNGRDQKLRGSAPSKLMRYLRVGVAKKRVSGACPSLASAN